MCQTVCSKVCFLYVLIYYEPIEERREKAQRRDQRNKIKGNLLSQITTNSGDFSNQTLYPVKTKSIGIRKVRVCNPDTKERKSSTPTIEAANKTKELLNQAKKQRKYPAEKDNCNHRGFDCGWPRRTHPRKKSNSVKIRRHPWAATTGMDKPVQGRKPDFIILHAGIHDIGKMK